MEFYGEVDFVKSRLKYFDTVGLRRDLSLDGGDPDGSSPFFVFGQAILTNRADLAPTSSENRTFKNDLEIIRSLFGKFGIEFVDQIEGDFALGVLDTKSQRLFLIRDQLGSEPLFFHQNDRALTFGSNPELVCKSDYVTPQFNRKKLKTLFLKEPHFYLPNESWYEGIDAIPAGHFLEFTREQTKLTKYWEPDLHEVEESRDLASASEEFRSLFESTIRSYSERSNKIGSFLSGGLDSSSVSAVAARTVERDTSLQLFASISEFPEVEDESEFIDSFSEVPNTTIHRCKAEGKGPFSDLDKLFENSSTPYMTSRHFLYRAMFQKAEDVGCDLILDGAYGELGPTFPGFGGFAEMLKQLRLVKLVSELTNRSRVSDESLIYNLRANAINPLLPEWLKQLKNRRRSEDVFERSFFTKDLQKDLIRSQADSDNEVWKTAASTHQNLYNNIFFAYARSGESTLNGYSDSKVRLAFPFLNKQLIEFCQKLPTDFHLRDGYSRYFIRAALEGILPEKIRWRTDKKPFSPDYMKRFIRENDWLREFVDSIRDDDPVAEIVDLKKLRKWSRLDFERASEDKDIFFLALHLLPIAVYLIYFMRKFPEFKS